VVFGVRMSFDRGDNVRVQRDFLPHTLGKPIDLDWRLFRVFPFLEHDPAVGLHYDMQHVLLADLDFLCLGFREDQLRPFSSLKTVVTRKKINSRKAISPIETTGIPLDAFLAFCVSIKTTSGNQL
ncbi:MAG: hypothetical protein V1794_03250, partial [Candidatus Glassbacteria bacterium]